MNVQELREEIKHQHELQKKYRKQLRILQEQAAGFGDLYAPAHIKLQITEYVEKLERSRQEIKQLTPKLIMYLQHEHNAFFQMLDVLKNDNAAAWIISTIAQLTGEVTPASNSPAMLDVKRRTYNMCTDRMDDLEQEIVNLSNM